MSIRTPVTMACSLAALLYAGTSFADDGWSDVDTSLAPQQQQQSPSGTVQQAPSTQGQQAQPQQPSTTTTTAAPYVVQQPATTTTSAPYAIPTGRVAERTVEERPNSDMLSTGVGLFILSYGASVVAAAESTREADKRLFIPVAGPWMNLQDRGCNVATPCGENEGMARALIVTSGIVQGFGALLTLGSLLVPETTTTQEKITAKAAPKPEVHVSPVSFGAGAGVGAFGRF